MQESIRYALQIADALGKAHAAGITHRDLKPGNIMVTGDGPVKILDFGLAKLGEAEPIGEDDATRTAALNDGLHTQDGAVLGTAAYTSPEQAEGKNADARSDIFSLGAVLYEMTTGRRAFTGDTSASTMGAALKSDPKRPGQLVEDLPRDFERIILRCLRKDPAKRFQHVTDLKVDLEELKETTDSGESVPAAVRKTPPRRWPWIAGTAACVAAIGAAWMLRQSAESPPRPLQPVSLTSDIGVEIAPSFSPDGSQVVYSADGGKPGSFSLYVKIVGASSTLRLTTDPAADNYPSWSPDGRQVAFVRSGQGIFLIPPIGGGERRVAPAWSPAGNWILYNDRGIKLISPDGKQTRDLSSLGHGNVCTFSRDGGLLYCLRLGHGAPRLFSANLEGKAERQIGLLAPEDSLLVLGYPGARLSLTPDGKGVSYSTRKDTYNLWLAEGLDAVTRR